MDKKTRIRLSKRLKEFGHQGYQAHTAATEGRLRGHTGARLADFINGCLNAAHCLNMGFGTTRHASKFGLGRRSSWHVSRRRFGRNFSR